MKENELPRMTIRMSPDEAQLLQRAWTLSGKFANRSQFVKAAINAYVGEQIFEMKRVEND